MKAIVAGGTGLIGSFLLERLSEDDAFERVVALTRREKEDRGKIHWHIANFEDTDALEASAEGTDVAFCALGTTIKKAGSDAAFEKVDFDYVFNFALAAKSAGVKHFLVVSAMGSDVDSRFFYSRVKGKMEKAMEGLGFEKLTIARPSFLEGPRKENRPGERISIVLTKFIAPLMVGKWKNYRPIHVDKVAKALVRSAKTGREGVLKWEDMKEE